MRQLSNNANNQGSVPWLLPLLVASGQCQLEHDSKRMH